MKTKNILLSAVFIASIASCQDQEDDWIDGSENGKTRDTLANGHVYRHYGGMWFPVFGGRISPSTYHGYNYNQINSRGFVPSRIHTGSNGTRSGGFGHTSSSHSSFGS